MSELQILGGRLLDGEQDTVSNLRISDGRISEIGAAAVDGLTTIDAEGCWVLPGVIDLAARTGEPGPPQAAGIASELDAAARCGITRLCQPPDCEPVIDTPAVVDWIADRARGAGRARLSLIGALTRELGDHALANMQTLLDAGCQGLGLGERPLPNAALLRSALQYAADCGATVHLRPMDAALGAGQLHEGGLATRLGIAGIPASAETIGLARLLDLAADTGVRLHLCRLSTAAAVDLLRAGRDRGLAISADVSALQLMMCVDELAPFDSAGHVQPPLRETHDRDALRAALQDGVIDALCSNHVPLDADAKAVPFPSSAPGASGLDTLLPAALSLHSEGVLDSAALVRALVTAPARILGLPVPRIAAGAEATLSILDPTADWTADPGQMLSRARITPLRGRHFSGRALGSLIAGQWQPR